VSHTKCYIERDFICPATKRREGREGMREGGGRERRKRDSYMGLF